MTGRSVALLTVVLMIAGGAAYAAPPHCPPGHAKKGWCQPGQRSWQPGDHVPRDRYVVIEVPRTRGLPPPGKGRIYVEVDEEILLIAAATGFVLDVLDAR